MSQDQTTIDALRHHFVEGELDATDLIAAAERAGRRRVRTRRIAAGGVTTAVLGAAAVITPQLVGASQVQPAAPAPVVAASSPAPTPSPSTQPTSSAGTKGALTDKARQQGASEPKRPSASAVQRKVVLDHLSGFTVTFTRTEQPYLIGKATDAQGTAHVSNGLDKLSPAEVTRLGQDCARDKCTKARVGSSTLYTFIDTEKVGKGANYYLLHADGGLVSFGQSGAFRGKGPVTRPGRVLTDKQVLALLNDPRWDAELATVTE